MNERTESAVAEKTLEIRSTTEPQQDQQEALQDIAESHAEERRRETAEQTSTPQSADIFRELGIPLPTPETRNAIETIRARTPHAARAGFAHDADEDTKTPPTPIAEKSGIRMFATSGR